MSGSPIFKGTSVVGFMSWNARAESFEDQSHEEVEVFGATTRVTKTVTMAMTNYGQAERLSKLESEPLPFIEGQPFGAFLSRLNAHEA
jgi:hypothetical protein